MLRDLLEKPSLKDYLLTNKVITEEDWGKVEQFIERGDNDFIATSKALGQNKEISKAIARYAELEFVALREIPAPSKKLLLSLPRNMICEAHVFAFGLSENKSTLYLATSNPQDNEIVDNISLRTNYPIKLFYASWDDIDAMISKYLGSVDAIEAAREYTKMYQKSEKTTQTSTIEINPDSPIIVVVNSILEQATKMKASDIHIEPFDTSLRVRYRIDGALVEQQPFPIEMHPAIIARLKVLGKMDIAERRLPQDGRISIEVDNIEYDIRVSLLPTIYGEKCVMRLALRDNLQREKSQLGLTPYDEKIFDKVFSNPNGIILVTGPTGSGKSTTLYTALSELNREDVNIVTVEDPVEANIDGINQVQTNAKAGMTFASALRSILRQDPDIIMIGEIRDEETAQIAVQAAVTGHLVVSTLHTNSASATITRLVNMGLEPYLVADSVVGIFAQRLVRRVCPHCSTKRPATPSEIQELGLKKEVQVDIPEVHGCAYCNNTGYKGRIAVYEIMDVGTQIKEMILKNATTNEIKKVAMESGMHTLHRSAAELVVRGITTISEMRKVSNEI